MRGVAPEHARHRVLPVEERRGRPPDRQLRVRRQEEVRAERGADDLARAALAEPLVDQIEQREGDGVDEHAGRDDEARDEDGLDRRHVGDQLTGDVEADREGHASESPEPGRLRPAGPGAGGAGPGGRRVPVEPGGEALGVDDRGAAAAGALLDGAVGGDHHRLGVGPTHRTMKASARSPARVNQTVTGPWASVRASRVPPAHASKTSTTRRFRGRAHSTRSRTSRARLSGAGASPCA